MTTYKLLYFRIRNLAEVTRLLFKLAEQPFDDCIVEFDKWPQIKEKVPFRLLPVLEVTDSNGTVQIAQSKAILRFVASRLGLDGSNDIERAQCDMIVEQIRDIFDKLVSVYKLPDSEEKNQRLTNALSDTIPNAYKLIQNILEENKNGNGFLVGNKVSYADVALMNSYDWLLNRKHEVLSRLSGLENHDKMIRNIPQLARHLEENKNLNLTILYNISYP